MYSIIYTHIYLVFVLGGIPFSRYELSFFTDFDAHVVHLLFLIAKLSSCSGSVTGFIRFASASMKLRKRPAATALVGRPAPKRQAYQLELKGRDGRLHVVHTYADVPLIRVSSKHI